MTTDDLIRELEKHPGVKVLMSKDPEGNSVRPLVEVTADFDGYVTLWPGDEEDRRPMNIAERNARIARLTDYQKCHILQKVHDALFAVDRVENGTVRLDPEKEWTAATCGEVAAAFAGTDLGYGQMTGESENDRSAVRGDPPT